MFHHQRRKIYADRLRQLNELGLPMPVEYGSVNDHTSWIVVEQAAADIDCPIVELQDGRTLYVAWLSLLAQKPGIYLYDYHFEPPWPDTNFETLPSFTDSSISQAYILPNLLEYPRADILNFRFGKTGWRLPYTRVEGVLCALSTTPIPEEFTHGDSIPVGVKFFGRSGQQLAAANVVLWADRWREPAVTRPTAKPPVAVEEAEPNVATRSPYSSLYDQGDENDLKAIGLRAENGSVATTGVREGSPGSRLFE